MRIKAKKAGMRKKQGIWVFDTGRPISAAAVERIRRQILREREQSFLGDLSNAKEDSGNPKSGEE